MIGGSSSRSGNVYATNPTTGIFGPVCDDEWDWYDVSKCYLTSVVGGPLPQYLCFTLTTANLFGERANYMKLPTQGIPETNAGKTLFVK